ncbi:hypothetical protein BRADI_2g02462v3 [Brachypodium distachyon]|uniref:Wall-associated receptor kinase galacturonan-binding domain-containing protein n=1 Tax=Brachypodium distachyon TaxID=15368 RepID=A0A0Q3IQM7_BRADI|nr:hypothetical protein BRADI_2g02462v3 [Brachypodium distachyon]
MVSPTTYAPLPLILFLVSGLVATATETPTTAPDTTTTTTNTSPCPSYRCGHAVDIRYPFWIDDDNDADTHTNISSSHCGYRSLRLECRRDTPVLSLPSGDYAVSHIQYGDRTVTLFDLGVFSRSNTCPLVAGRNLTLPPDNTTPPLSLTDRDTNLTFFIHCSPSSFAMPLPATAGHLVACLEGDGMHHSYVFHDGDGAPPYYGLAAGACQDVVGMPVLRRSLLGRTTGAGPLDAVVPALNMGFELGWRPETGGECGGCEKAGGWCGHRRGAAGQPWAFACFLRTAASGSAAAASVAPKASVVNLAVPAAAAAQTMSRTFVC